MGTASLTYRGASVSSCIYDRNKFTHGSTVTGPALICESSSTIFLPPGYQCAVDRFSNIIITKA